MLNRFRSEQAESSAGERNDLWEGVPKSLLYLQVISQNGKVDRFLMWCKADFGGPSFVFCRDNAGTFEDRKRSAVLNGRAGQVPRVLLRFFPGTEKGQRKVIKLIALDLDDTLLMPDGTIPEGVAETLREAERRGVGIVIATGRSYPVGENLCRDTGI